MAVSTLVTRLMHVYKCVGALCNQACHQISPWPDDNCVPDTQRAGGAGGEEIERDETGLEKIISVVS